MEEIENKNFLFWKVSKKGSEQLTLKIIIILVAAVLLILLMVYLINNKLIKGVFA